MNGLAALVRWRGEPLAATDLDSLLAALGGGSAARAGDAFARVAAVAAERGAPVEAGLAVDAERGLVVALSGRLDAPADLARAAGLDAAPRAPAELLLAAYAAVGDRLFDRLVGPFVALVVDLRRRTVLLARDPLGCRTLYLRRRAGELAVATRAAPLARLDGGAAEPFDERALAGYLSIGGPPAGSSFFRDVEELPPGALLTLGPGGSAMRRIDLVAEGRPGRGRDEEYEARFRELLDAAVACRLPAAGRAAVLMSGGLDSTSVAAAAARESAGRGGAPPLTVSWVFDELPGIDERRWIDAANRAFGTEPRAIVADALWPLAEPGSWPRLLDTPAASPFALPRRRAFAAARDAGCGVLLTGESADDLWWESSEWLRSLLAAGQLGRAAVETASLAARAVRSREHRRALRAALARLRRPHGYLPSRDDWPWLTPFARALRRSDDTAQGAGDPLWRELRQPAHPLVYPLDLTFLRAAEEESAPFGIAVRRPFRDRRLVEFMLGVPPRLLYRPGERKRLLRRALADRLPPAVAERRERTSLLPLYRRGLAERGRAAVDALLERDDALWRRYVRADWLESEGRRQAASGDGAEALVLWHCVAVERWRDEWRNPLASAPLPR